MSQEQFVSMARDEAAQSPTGRSSFWCVICPTNPKYPITQHPTPEAAQNEAKNSAMSNMPGRHFYVMEAKLLVQVQPSFPEMQALKQAAKF